MNEISNKAHEYLDSTIELLKDFISFPSVDDTPEEGMPYGKACADMMKYAEKILTEDGFVVNNFGNHAVTASFDEREPELGILCHLDVVPVEGQSWTSDPFKAEIRGNRIYGRGAIDDKGPAAAVITAMRMIRDSGIKLDKNVRLILGSNEEKGSADMEYYTSKEKFPPMLFTPDGSFPVINIEKGMIRLEITGEYTADETAKGKFISLKGGSVANAVPELATAVVSGIGDDDLKNALFDHSSDEIETHSEKDENSSIISSRGKGAHASTPDNGHNALTALIGKLAAMPLENELTKKFAALSELFPYGDNKGKAMGIACSDELSGDLTFVLSLADCRDGKLSFTADCRFPVCRNSAELVNVMKEKLETAGFTAKAVMTSEPHHVDENSKMIQTLLSVYEDCTGEKGRCLAIGGGTYVHETDNGVAFGAEWSDENNMHGADEFIGIDELEKDIRIYAEAILRLCSKGE